MIGIMFNLQQINDIHDKFGKSETLGLYLKELRLIGVNLQESYLSDGHSVYYGNNGEKLESPSIHKTYIISDNSDKNSFMRTLKLAEEGKLNYFDMSEQFAHSGVEKWVFDTDQMTITYYDKIGDTLLREDIK